MQIELRRATMDDLETLLPLVTAYHEFEAIETSAEQRIDALRFLLGEQEFGALWLISEASRLAGYIVLCKGYSIEFGGFDGFVDEFYLDPEFRGRGIGKTVLERVDQLAQQLDIRALHLEVARDNQRARRLYRETGFEAREKYVLMTREFDQS